MATTIKTIFLNPNTWDFDIDEKGNIAVADAPYSIAQDVSSAIRLFKGEQIYNSVIGVPYLQQLLGLSPPLSMIKAEIVKAALSVNGVVSATCYLDSTTDRNIKGRVLITDINNQTTTVTL